MTQTSTQLTGIPRTMLMTTRARAEEHQRPDALFRDPKVAEWFKVLPWDTELDRLYTPLAQLSWAMRAHLFDQIAQRHIATHSDAVVVELGSGLSTRFYRVGQACQCWIELDLPEVTSLRLQLDMETEQHRFISHSALDFQWLNELPICPPENLLIIAEGLLMYFEITQVQQLTHQLRQRFPGATFAFDAVGGSSKGKGAKQLAQLGAPLKWFIKNEHDVTALGLSLLQTRSLVQENCRYRDRIGFFRWIPWLAKLPGLRNASLILETKLNPLDAVGKRT
ncbi:MAG: class I SAM-dependent methyltransferase [Cyanobacteria bacterium P01_E01_bin.6]